MVEILLTISVGFSIVAISIGVTLLAIVNVDNRVKRLEREKKQPDPPPRPSKGRVITVKSAPEYDSNPPPRAGGRVVKAMPRQLQKIKEGQERTDGDV